MSEISLLREKAGLSVEQLAALSGFDIRTVYRWESGDQAPRPAVIEMLKAKINTKPATGSHSKFTFIDLFAGIGGIRKGFETIGGHCVFTSEWDKNCQRTYRANFPHDDHEIAGDITKVEAGDIPVHDVLLAGFPCQPFSLAGVSKKKSLNRAHGFEDKTQGTLFFDVARIIAHHRPKAFLLENVKNLQNHDKGNTFKIIREVLERDLGYQISVRIIDAKSFVPQHRERIFIVGFRDTNDFTLNNLEIPPTSEGPKLRNILHPENGTEAADEHYLEAGGIVSERYTLTPKLWEYLQGYAKKHKEKGNGFGFGLVGPNNTARTLSARYYKDGSEILIDQPGKRPRRLTPRECARLMGYEKIGGEKFRIPVSDTQAYKQFGNSVVVPVIEAVAKHMEPWLIKINSLETINSSSIIEEPVRTHG